MIPADKDESEFRYYDNEDFATEPDGIEYFQSGMGDCITHSEDNYAANTDNGYDCMNRCLRE
jgi:hypothetical protein